MRIEKKYLENLKSSMDILRKDKTDTLEQIMSDIIDNALTSDTNIIALYKNVAETWNELTAYIRKYYDEFKQFKDETVERDNELNEKINEVNVALRQLISELDEKIDDVYDDLDSKKQDRLTAGEGITITNNVISANANINRIYGLAMEWDISRGFGIGVFYEDAQRQTPIGSFTRLAELVGDNCILEIHVFGSNDIYLANLSFIPTDNQFQWTTSFVSGGNAYTAIISAPPASETPTAPVLTATIKSL